MNLEQLTPAAVQALYPPISTRSGKTIHITEATSAFTKDGVLVAIATLFPPSERRRAELLVTASGAELSVAPLEPQGIVDAQRFAERLRASLPAPEAGRPLPPLRFVKDAHGRASFRIGEPPPPDEAPETLPAARGNTRPPPPPADKPETEKGAS